MAMDAKQRKLVMIRLGAAVVLVLGLLFLGWFLFWPDSQPATRQSQLGPSDTMLPAAPQKVDQQQPGRLVAQPNAVQFTQDKPDTIVFTLAALDGPVSLRGIGVPQQDADAIQAAFLDCPSAPATLNPGASCAVSVTWNGTRSITSTIQIAASVTNTGGVAVDQPLNIAVSGVSTRSPGAPAPADGQAGAPPPADAAGAQPVAAAGPSPAQQARDAYLAGRRGGGIQIANSQFQPAARSPYTSWDNIGVQGTKSSYPTDMSRVITPDKPITAVLTYQIDTRQTVTAVAMVDRDVYGSSGRTVVIPRGTKLVGRVGGGATDRVGIAWNQLIRPDGVRFVFEGESGDAMGRGGVPGRINNRYLQRYGYSIVPNAIAAGITAALGGQSTQNGGGIGGGVTQQQDARAVAAQILSEPLNRAGQDLAQRNQAIPVQITIPAGTRMTIWSTGDLRLKPVGERDAQPNQAEGGATFGSGQGGGQGQRGGGYAAPAPAQAARPTTTQSGGQGAATRDEGNTSALQVGRVDANGNYIAPGSTAPAPGPVTRPAPQQQGAAQPGTQPRNGSNFPTSSNPWQ